MQGGGFFSDDRGVFQEDLELFGLTYLQKICDAGAGLTNGPKLERLDWAAVHIGKSIINQEIIP